jgi:adhesin transport system outer membrane protein
MMISKVSVCTLIVFAGLLRAGAQEVYDLKRCIATGLERNYSILISKNQAEVSAANFTAGNAGLLPVIDISSRYSGTLRNTQQEFASGKDTSMNGIHNTTAGAGINLGWSIFRGFSALTTYKKLNELKQIGELNAQLSVEDFIAEITAEYYLYIQQLQLYQNLAYAVSLSRERVRIDQERYLLGAASKLQLLQSLVYLNSDSSRYSKQREVLRASQVRINRLMATDDIGQHFTLTDSIILINTNLEFDSLLMDTENSNTSLLIARRSQTVSQYDYRIIASRTYPYLDLSAGYDFNHYLFESNAIKNQQVDGLNYGLTLGINLFDGFNQRREKANARLEIENRDYVYQEIDQQVKADLITIYYAYENNLLLLELELENLKTANENLEIALERYKLGSLSGLELREVQKSLLEAEERLLLVQYQTKLAEISLLQISGRISAYLR